MIRSISIALALMAGPATAGEPMDCYNDETDTGARYTSTTPEVLRITDADIADMLARIREHEIRFVASPARDPAVLVRLGYETPASD